MESRYYDLLKVWCDKLLELQVKGTENKNFDGGILCPACKHIHGRCDNAIYPFLFLADKTKEYKYTDAAKRLFDWQENMLCDDGSVYNDAGNAWCGITVFSANNLLKALTYYAYLLDGETKSKWADRLLKMTEWLYQNLNVAFHSNINYQCANAAVMAAAGNYFNNSDYKGLAAELLRYALSHFTDDGLLYGEGHPVDAITKHGCRPIDIGYNVEESVPSLMECAILIDDQDVLGKLRIILRKQLDFMLPDGAWDNSFGSRNNKWTYWGSRTSDGCLSAYTILAKDNPMFMEAAIRNADLLLSCTHNGLLYGGPDYHLNGEEPCVHHTFCHAASLAAALEHGLNFSEASVALPADNPEQKVKYYRELNVYKITQGNFRATVTGYDFDLSAGHISGGTLSLLWHKKAGPVIAASVLDYRLKEPLNMQLSLGKKKHRALVPRAELSDNHIRYSQCYDTNALISCKTSANSVEVNVNSKLVSIDGRSLDDAGITCTLNYRIENDKVRVKGQLKGEQSDKAVFVLPVVRNNAKVLSDSQIINTADIFFLTGGFSAKEYTIKPDENGNFCVLIEVEKSSN